MKPFVRTLCLLVSLGLVAIVVAVPALAGSRPIVTSLSSHRATYWGGATITVHGHNFTHVRKVMFGSKQGHGVHVVSSTKLTVRDPFHRYGSTYIRVVTSTGWSDKGSASKFTFTHPTMNSHIQGGLTGRQEQSISARVRSHHRGVYTAHRSSHWTAAMGVTALMRARSWLGLPYSWAGGNSSGPTRGVCAHNGGDMDCHIIGFDCSGLTLYAWAPYVHLTHFAATQRGQAGRFHPSIGQLVPGDLVYFSDSPRAQVGHTAIYEGNGNVIQAEQSGYAIMRTPLRTVIAFSGSYRGATRPTSSGKQAPGPRLTSRTTQIAAKGGYLTINGAYLSTATTVVVAGKTYYSFARRTSSQLVLKMPAHRAGAVSVAVSNPWGTANTSFTYVAAPQVSWITPPSGPITGTTAVTVTGTNLSTVTKVTVGTATAPFTRVSSTRLTVTVPAAASPGAVAVTLYSPFGTSNQKSYTYLAAVPPTTAARPTTPSSSSPAPPSSSSSSPAPPSGTTSAPPSSTSAPPSSTSAPPSSAPASSTTAGSSTGAGAGTP